MSVTTSRDPSPPDHDAAFREQWWTYVLHHADGWQQHALSRLFDHWQRLNAEHFAGAMVAPYVLLAEPSNPRRLGDTGPTSAFGGRCQIRIRPSLLEGGHPQVRSGAEHAAGRFAFVADVLAHEMIHQWQQEVTGQREDSYHGHGPAFTAKANEIGARWALSEVVVRNRGGSARPKAAQWPHCVRPSEHYHGAWQPFVSDTASRDTTPCPRCHGTGRLPTPEETP